MGTRGVGLIALFVLAAACVWPAEAWCHETRDEQRLPKIGPAPEFTLTDQNGKRIALTDLHGKVLAITFIFASCADTHGANPAGWAFLTGTPAEIREVARRYGVFYKKTPRGDVDHTFLTSLVDRSGTLRVQYMGIRFDPDEMLRDLQSLSEAPKTR